MTPNAALIFSTLLFACTGVRHEVKEMRCAKCGETFVAVYPPGTKKLKHDCGGCTPATWGKE